jgi:hypothetical protein
VRKAAQKMELQIKAKTLQIKAVAWLQVFQAHLQHSALTRPLPFLSCHVATPPGGMNMRPPKGGLSKTMSFSSWNKSILNKSRVLSIADSNNSSHRSKKGMYQVFSPTGCHRLHPQGQDLQSGPHSFVDLYSHEQILCFGDFFKPTKILFGDQTWQ